MATTAEKATLAKSAQVIDNLVYELYDLTDEEIAIVEEGRGTARR